MKTLIQEHIRDDANGKRAFLPHPVFQSSLFSVARDPGIDLNAQGRLARGGGVVLIHTNRFGDVITIEAPRRLYCNPDLATFLSVVALAQQAGIREYRLEGKTLPIYFSTFGMRDLYNLMGIPSKKGNRLCQSMRAVGGTNITVQYAHPDKHSGLVSWVSGSFWNLDIISRRGKKGNIVELTLNPFLVPHAHYLYADAVDLNALKKDTARGIYWTLLCRQHLKATVTEWQEILLSTDSNIARFEDKSFVPALAELHEKIGYSWRKEENGKGETVYIVSRKPKRGEIAAVEGELMPPN